MAEARCAVAFQFTMTNDGLPSLFINKTLLKNAIDKFFKSCLCRLMKIASTYSKIAFPLNTTILYIIFSLVMSTYYVNQSLTTKLISLIKSTLILTPSFAKPILACIILACLLWFLIGFIIQLIIRIVIYKFAYKSSFASSNNGSKSMVSYIQMAIIKKIFQLNDSLMGLQRCIPRMAVPTLEHTVSMVMKSCQPVLNEADLVDLNQMAEDFLKNTGPSLQKYLVLKSWIVNNYVTDWWEQFVYLRGRSPIVINSNYYGLDIWHQPTSDQTLKAATSIRSLFIFKKIVYNERLKPILHQGTVPLCSNQYKRIFNTCRIPGKEQDHIVHHQQSDYIVIYHNGRYFKVVLEFEDKVPDIESIQKVLKDILNDKSEANIHEKQLASLTAWNRTDWHNIRNQFFSLGTNYLSMDIIERAAFFVVLEDFPMHCDKNSENLTNMAMSSIAGNGYDRWFDKSFNIIFYSNGTCGFNVEHSWADAPIFSHLMEYCCLLSIYPEKYAAEMKPFIMTDKVSLNYDRIKWEFVGELIKSIDMAVVDVKHRIEDLDLVVTVHDIFGKGLIKKCNCSPDAFIQISLQMAYYKETGKFDLTYESSMARLFRDGRTETVRSCTNETRQFVLSMFDSKETDASRISYFRLAAENHVNLYRKAMLGLGVDRHLFALYVMSRVFNMKVPFLEKILSEPWRLSTSQTPLGISGELDYNKSPELSSAGGGFGPVADDGYGVSYIIAGDNQISFHVSSKRSCPKTDSKRFTEHIFASMSTIKNLILSKNSN